MTPSPMRFAARVFLASAHRRFLHMWRYKAYVRQIFFFGPLEFVLPFVFTFSAFSAERSEMFTFVLLGTVGWSWFHNILWDIGSLVREEQVAGTLEAVLLTPAPRAAWIFGNMLAALVFNSIGTGLCGAIFVLLFQVPLQPNALSVAVLVLLCLAAGSGLALVVACLILYLKKGINVMSIFVDTTFTISGATFPLRKLPLALMALAFLLPFTWVLEGLRDALLHAATIHELRGPILATLALTAVVFAAGLVLFTRTEHALRRSGEIHQF